MFTVLDKCKYLLNMNQMYKVMTLLDRLCMITVLIGVLKPNFQIHILGQVRKDVFGAMLGSELYQAVQEMKSTVGFPWHWVRCEHISKRSITGYVRIPSLT